MITDVYFQDAHVSLLDQYPHVDSIQREFMRSNGFLPVLRDGNNVLWEFAACSEAKIWLRYNHTDLSARYLMVRLYQAGVEEGHLQMRNQFRETFNLEHETPEMRQRVSSFLDAWRRLSIATRGD